MSQGQMKPAREMDIHELEQFIKSQIVHKREEASNHTKESFATGKERNTGIVEEEMHAECIKKIKNLEEKVQFLEEQCRFARAETKRVSDQYEIDKVNWALQMEHIKKQTTLSKNGRGLQQSRKSK